MGTTPTRLSKQARREQLLDTAVAIVRTRGADGLTLVTLAEEAGVSRPVVYGHFATRPGLLLALHRRLDERHRAAVTRALRSAATGADAVARAISTAYFACATDMPELGAVTAALKGSPEMEAVRRESADRYAELMATVLRPYSPLAPKDLVLRCRRRTGRGRRARGRAEPAAGDRRRGGRRADRPDHGQSRGRGRVRAQGRVRCRARPVRGWCRARRDRGRGCRCRARHGACRVRCRG